MSARLVSRGSFPSTTRAHRRPHVFESVGILAGESVRVIRSTAERLLAGVGLAQLHVGDASSPQFKCMRKIRGPFGIAKNVGP